MPIVCMCVLIIPFVITFCGTTGQGFAQLQYDDFLRVSAVPHFDLYFDAFFFDICLVCNVCRFRFFSILCYPRFFFLFDADGDAIVKSRKRGRRTPEAREREKQRKRARER